MPTVYTRNIPQQQRRKWGIKRNGFRYKYLFDDTQDADIRGNDDDQWNDQSKDKHVENVRPVVVHFRLPIHRAAAFKNGSKRWQDKLAEFLAHI